MPGGSSCMVAICKKNSKKAKSMGENLMFFRFPKNPTLRKQWVLMCHRKDKFDPENKRICSVHFRDKDYEDEMQARLMGIRSKKLKHNAVPSLHLLPGESSEKPQAISHRAKRAQQKEQKLLVETLISEADNYPKKNEHIIAKPRNDCPTTSQNEHIEKPEKPNNDAQDQSTTAKSTNMTEINELREKIALLTSRNAVLEEQILQHKEKENRLILQLDTAKAHYMSKIKSLASKITDAETNFATRVKRAFRGVLTSNQVDIILKKKGKARWTTEEYTIAFTLRKFSKRSYLYLKNTLHYPLPGVSTLQSWAANIELKNGDDALSVMRVQKMNNMPKVLVKVMPEHDYAVGSF